jgi:hypothetical protein
MQLKRWAIALMTSGVLVLGIVSQASAVVVDFGVRDVTSTGTDAFGDFQAHTQAEAQPFTDSFNFGVNGDTAVTFELQVNNSQGRLIDVTTGSASLFSAELLAGGASIGSGVFATQNGVNGTTFTLAFANLDPGIDYTLRVIGTVLAAAGGTYTFSANLSNVPLPAAVWLFLSALAGLATLARTRRGRQTV